MKRLIIGMAAAGAACLLGCATNTSVAGYSSDVASPTRIAQNPDIARGDNGPLIPGTVVADYRDTLIIKDDKGFERAMRVDEQTLYRKDGDIIAREYLAPGAQVRASFDYNDKERIAREVIIENEPAQCEPNSWPEEPTPYRRDL
ncbi:hypothetical protein [Hyalangium versicolor]|uniref:hypothetical protein n=1 Tax=Hyalangium versicolor TaxID=2861190 RepID=UPI001CC9A7A6|nr:hypothetical protein [Hyalangium versicolor]